jgi:hypothetical protein
LGIDPLLILQQFVSDDRLDKRYRELTLNKMVRRIQTARNGAKAHQRG